MMLEITSRDRGLVLSLSKFYQEEKPNTFSDSHVNYSQYTLEWLPDGTYYRRFFANKEHKNYVGVSSDLEPIIVSIRREKNEVIVNRQEEGTFAYRCILRKRNVSDPSCL